MSGKWVPVPDQIAQMKPMAASPAGTISCSAQVAWPHDLVAGEANLGRFLQGRRGHDARCAQDDPVGLGDLDPQPGRLLVEPRRLHRQVLHRKAVVGGLGVEDGKGFPAIVIVDGRHGRFSGP